MGQRHEQIRIAGLMESSGVKFGTSGARGLATDMNDRVCYAYTRAFLQHLQQQDAIRDGSQVALAGDFRPSSPRIMTACAMAIRDAGFIPLNCGYIPTPAVTLHGMNLGIPSLMVTGSHIPDDRNGIKFNTSRGEITKSDEQSISGQTVTIDADRFDAEGMATPACPLSNVDDTARADYISRYLEFFPAGCLNGLRIGIYQHSSVARDILTEIIAGLGGEAIALGRSETFIPVDTEAIRAEDVRLAHDWAKTLGLDCIISTDGDGDRPLISDEEGEWLRGDIAGILCARQLGITHLATPVSSNSAVEKCGWFDQVMRTRIGSPFVIEAMEASKGSAVAGYEANGGFLTATDIVQEGRRLTALPTRDAVIVPLAILMFSNGKPLSTLVQLLPPRFTYSDRLKAFPTEVARGRIDALNSEEAIEAIFGELFGQVTSIDRTDGLRITFANDEIVHLRPSGNAPELRCYNEAATHERAAEMNRLCLSLMETWRNR